MNLEELKSLALEIDCAALKGLVYPPSRIADVIGPRLHAIVAKLEAAQRLRDALDGQADGIADAIDAFDAVVKK